MIYTCNVCNRVLVTRADECLDDGVFPEVVSYVAVLRLDNTEPLYCCAECVDDNAKPGKYEHNHGRNDLGRCLLLDSLSEHEDEMGNGYEWCARDGRYFLYVDYSGFITFEDCGSEEKALKRWDEIYADGMGYNEEDAVISEDGAVYFGGKPLDISRPWNSDKPITDNRCYAAIALEMHRQGFYPDVWLENRYGVTLCQDFYKRTAGIDDILNATKKEV